MVTKCKEFLLLFHLIKKNFFNRDQKQKVYPIVKLTDCIQNFFNPVRIDDFFSTAVNRKTFATM